MTVRLTGRFPTGNTLTYTDVKGWNFHFDGGWLELVRPNEVLFFNLDNLTEVAVPNLNDNEENETEEDEDATGK